MSWILKIVAFGIFLIVGAVTVTAREVLPISGSWINLFYQDVRNKYTNPEYMDNTDPTYWRAKVVEMKNLGIEYIIFMATANEGKSAYPSEIMPHAYDERRMSPVCAIMEEADRLGMKVLMSIGWAENQDDDLRNPTILQRQTEIMNELAHLYGNRPSFYGWYLPVEDRLGPILSDEAVNAVNLLVEKAHILTPGKKTMISPYGFYCSKFDDPAFGNQIRRLKVDIIAYQDEVGCVRDEFPMPRLKENWKKMRAIHDDTDIEMWANCELFTWEKGANSRQSALTPAAFPRVVSQLAAASQGGVSRIVSFMVYGIWDTNVTPYAIGQPVESKRVADDYCQWLAGSGRWSLLEASLIGKLKNECVVSDNPLFDGTVGEENPTDNNWVKYSPGFNAIEIPYCEKNVDTMMVRFLNCEKKGIVLPYKVFLYSSDDGKNYNLEAVKDVPYYFNTRHDAWIDCVVFESVWKKYLRLGFESDKAVAIDEIYINPLIQ